MWLHLANAIFLNEEKEVVEIERENVQCGMLSLLEFIYIG